MIRFARTRWDEWQRALSAHLARSVGSIVSAQLQTFQMQQQREFAQRPRLAGVLMLGSYVSRDAPPFASSVSFELEPGEEHRHQIYPQVPVAPGAVFIAWGACTLVDVVIGNEVAGAWPGDSLMFIAPRGTTPGVPILVTVRGWPK